MRIVLLLGLVACALLLAGPSVSAHVGPSDTSNNRYYKLTPMSDRVRLAYTIFFGREPALVTRRRMDVDRDGVLSPDEVAAYGDLIAKEVLASVSFQLDGKDVDVLWQDIDVGMQDTDVGAGPFSVDLIGTVCLRPGAAGNEHQLRFRDRLRLPKPGETELSLAPAPGIRMTRSVLDGKPSRHEAKWQGGPGPAQAGYEFAFVVESADMPALDDSCLPRADASASRMWMPLALAGLAAALGALLWRHRARKSVRG